MPKVMPGFWVAHVLGEQNGDVLRQLGIFGEGTADETWAGAIKHVVIGPEHVRYAAHHGFEPLRVSLGEHTILDDHLEERVPCSSTKRVVADFPIGAALGAQVAVEGQLLKRNNAIRIEQWVEAGPQENVEIKVEAAQAVNCQVPKKIKPLYLARESSEHGLIFGRFGGHELRYLGVVEINVLPIRVKQLEVSGGSSGNGRQVSSLAGLDDTVRNHK